MTSQTADGSPRRLRGRAAEASILTNLVDLVGRGHSAVLATVIRTDRSVPRHPGAKMLVTDDGHRFGSVGGGEMEARVIREAEACLADGRPRLLDYDLINPGAGDPGVCGGRVTIHLEPHMPPSTVLVIGCGHIGRAVRDRRPGVTTTDQCGGGATRARAVTELAHWLGYRVVATDDRPGTAEEVTGADLVVAGPISEVLEQVVLTPRDHAVVVTRNTDLDVESLRHLLATEIGSIGVMGSARRWQTTCQSLADLGIALGDIERVTSPIGLELGAENPEEIAVSIMAQLVAQDRSTTG